MAPLMKTKHDHILSSNIVHFGSPAPKQTGTIQSTPVKNGESATTSYQQAMAITYQMLMAIALDMGVISKGYNQSQSDQAAISGSEAQETTQNGQAYIKKLAEFQEEQKKAHFWSVFGDVVKWVGVAVAAVVGALLCETPAGFAILAAVIGLTASGVLNKGLSVVGDKLGQAMGSSTWGNIIVQVVFIAILTVATAGAEAGCSASGLTKAVTEAMQSTAQVATKAGEEVLENMAADVGQTTTQATTQATSTAEQTSFGSAMKNSLNGYATRTVAVTSLTSTNVIGELVQESIEHIPGNSTAKTLVETIFTLAITVAVAMASFKGLTDNPAFLNKLTQVLPNLKTGLFAFQGVGGAVNDVATGGNSWTNYVGAGIQEGEAPLQAAMDRGQGMTQVFNSLTQVTQEVMKSMMQAYQPIFSINFGAGWQAAAQGLA